jgi:hypothetical protein
MSGPPNVGVLVPVEFLEGLIDPVLQPFGTSVTDDVQDSGSDPDIFVVDQLKHSFPEDVNVLENFARAKLLDCLQPDVVIFVVSIIEDDLNILSVPALAHDLLLVEVSNALILLPVVPTLRHNQLIIHHASKRLKNKFNSLTNFCLINS